LLDGNWILPDVNWTLVTWTDFFWMSTGLWILLDANWTFVTWTVFFWMSTGWTLAIFWNAWNSWIYHGLYTDTDADIKESQIYILDIDAF
jgi:hypothetical protein